VRGKETTAAASSALNPQVDFRLALAHLYLRARRVRCVLLAYNSPRCTWLRHPVGPYKIEEPIGAGGMGEVYRATDTRLNGVAVKILPARLTAEPGAKLRFEREAHTASALNDPHICTIYDVENTRGSSSSHGVARRPDPQAIHGWPGPGVSK